MSRRPTPPDDDASTTYCSSQVCRVSSAACDSVSLISEGTAGLQLSMGVVYRQGVKYCTLCNKFADDIHLKSKWHVYRVEMITLQNQWDDEQDLPHAEVGPPPRWGNPALFEWSKDNFRWRCKLCNCCSDDSHVRSKKHLRGATWHAQQLLQEEDVFFGAQPPPPPGSPPSGSASHSIQVPQGKPPPPPFPPPSWTSTCGIGESAGISTGESAGPSAGAAATHSLSQGAAWDAINPSRACAAGSPSLLPGSRHRTQPHPPLHSPPMPMQAGISEKKKSMPTLHESDDSGRGMWLLALGDFDGSEYGQDYLTVHRQDDLFVLPPFSDVWVWAFSQGCWGWMPTSHVADVPELSAVSTAALRAELEEMTRSDLWKRAKASGVSEAALISTLDIVDTKAAVVELIIATEAPPAVSPPTTAAPSSNAADLVAASPAAAPVAAIGRSHIQAAIGADICDWM